MTVARSFDEVWDDDRAHVVRLAARLLHDPAEAEDVVQEAFGRLAAHDLAEIDDVRGWLAVVVRRRCLDRLRSAHSRRESAADLSGASADTDLTLQGRRDVDPADRVTLDEQLQVALALVLERLSPAERTAFVLHDVFGFPFEAVAEIVGRTSAACRQLASRARRSIRDGAPPARIQSPSNEHRRLADRFVAASAGGDIAELMEVLDPNVSGEATMIGGGRLNLVVGRSAVARQFLDRFGPSGGRTLQPIVIEDKPGLLSFGGGRVDAVIVLDATGGIVHHIHSFVRRR
jgi:RNA polymerase sigma-70 factor (ECF subfamily)